MITCAADCLPGDVRYKVESLDTLDRHLKTLIDESKLHSASYILSRYGKVFSCKSFGPLTYKNSAVPFGTDSIRNIGSITKAFTAVAILQLIERGLIHLYQPVMEIIGEFDDAVHERITIFHLLTHTAGIVADPGYFSETDVDEDLFWNRFGKNGWIADILKETDVKSFETNWNYSSSSYALLGEIICRTSAQGYKEFIHQNIIRPLGLTNTWLGDMPESCLDRMCFASKNDESFFMNYYRKDSPLYASGGIDTTLTDLYTFARMLLNYGLHDNKQILSRQSVETMTTNQLKNQFAFFWGQKIDDFKFGLGAKIIDDEGITKGSYEFSGSGFSFINCDPEKEFVAAWFVPMNVSCFYEAHEGVRNIIWKGIQ